MFQKKNCFFNETMIFLEYHESTHREDKISLKLKKTNKTIIRIQTSIDPRRVLISKSNRPFNDRSIALPVLKLFLLGIFKIRLKKSRWNQTWFKSNHRIDATPAQIPTVWYDQNRAFFSLSFDLWGSMKMIPFSRKKIG